jgi:hypothetical protein
MVSNTMNTVSKIPVLKLLAGETLKLRVYPWYSSAATGKTICLSDVKIHGVALPASNLSIDQFSEKKLTLIAADGLVKIKNAPLNSKVTIYDLTGKQIHKSSIIANYDVSTIEAPKMKGIYIGKIESEEGTQTIKFLVP